MVARIITCFLLCFSFLTCHYAVHVEGAGFVGASFEELDAEVDEELTPDTLELMLELERNKQDMSELSKLFQQGIEKAFMQEFNLVGVFLVRGAEEIMTLNCTQSSGTGGNSRYAAQQSSADAEFWKRKRKASEHLKRAELVVASMSDDELDEINQTLKKYSIDDVLETRATEKNSKFLWMNVKSKETKYLEKDENSKISTVLAALTFNNMLPSSNMERLATDQDLIYIKKDFLQLNSMLDEIEERIQSGSMFDEEFYTPFEKEEYSFVNNVFNDTVGGIEGKLKDEAQDFIVERFLKYLLKSNVVRNHISTTINDNLEVSENIANIVEDYVTTNINSSNSAVNFSAKTLKLLKNHRNSFIQSVKDIVNTRMSSSTRTAIERYSSKAYFTRSAGQNVWGTTAVRKGLGEALGELGYGVVIGTAVTLVFEFGGAFIHGTDTESVEVGNTTFSFRNRYQTYQGYEDASKAQDGVEAMGLTGEEYAYSNEKRCSVGAGIVVGAIVAVCTGGASLPITAAIGIVSGVLASNGGGWVGKKIDDAKDKAESIQKKLKKKINKMDTDLSQVQVATKATELAEYYEDLIQHGQTRQHIFLINDFKNSIEFKFGKKMKFKILKGHGDNKWFHKKLHTRYDFVNLDGEQALWDMKNPEGGLVNVGSLEKSRGMPVEFALNEKCNASKINKYARYNPAICRIYMENDTIPGNSKADFFRVLSNGLVVAKFDKNSRWTIRGMAPETNIYFRNLKQTYTWNGEAYVPMK
jgi:hypothetical protein